MGQERKIHNFDSVVLVERTIEEEGFDPSLVGYQKKHIWASCRFCGEPHRIYGANFKKAGSACHKKCRLKEQSVSGSPFSDPTIKEKARKNRTKNISREEINRRISEGRKAVQEQIEATCLDKYGVKNPFQSEKIKNKIEATNIKKYGINHAMKDPIRVQKALSKFNLTVEDDSDDRYRLINLLRGTDFWRDLKDKDATLESIADAYNVPYKSLTATLLKNEFRDRYYATYSFPKFQAQKKVINALTTNLSSSLRIEQNTRTVITPLELDIYLPDKSFAIEYNGSHWHSEARLTESEARRKHIQKTRACLSKGIRLFHIFEHTWLKREPQILNFLKSTLGLNSTKVAGRKCLITNDEQRQFIDDNHIQGYGRGTIKYFNLVYEGEIVGCMTASGHHRQNGNDKNIVLNRLCFKDGVTVQGGASKLFKAFCEWAKSEGYESVISWSDNCWTEGGVYGQLGFELEAELPVDYFYYDTNDRSYKSKQSQRKKAVNCPEGMTERDWAMERGLYRIWDCGKKRWIFKL